MHLQDVDIGLCVESLNITYGLVGSSSELLFLDDLKDLLYRERKHEFALLSALMPRLRYEHEYAVQEAMIFEELLAQDMYLEVPDLEIPRMQLQHIKTEGSSYQYASERLCLNLHLGLDADSIPVHMQAFLNNRPLHPHILPSGKILMKLQTTYIQGVLQPTEHITIHYDRLVPAINRILQPFDIPNRFHKRYFASTF